MAMRALLDVRGRHVQVVVTHLAVEQPSRELQVPALMRFAGGYGGPTIITGDFNALSNAPELKSLRKRYRDAQQIAELRTRTARGGRIDYVYVTRNIDVLGARVGPAGFSDHRPLVAELRLPR
jgi:endonuclease/exonuclease/phosphatase family metal-dependent hydrolase